MPIIKLSEVVAKMQAIAKYNPYRDAQGRFASGGAGAKTMSAARRAASRVTGTDLSANRNIGDVGSTSPYKRPSMRRGGGYDAEYRDPLFRSGKKKSRGKKKIAANRKGKFGGRKKSRATKPRPKISRGSSSQGQTLSRKGRKRIEQAIGNPSDYRKKDGSIDYAKYTKLLERAMGFTK